MPYSDNDGDRRLLDPDNVITSNRAMIGVWGSATNSDLYVPHGEQYDSLVTCKCATYVNLLLSCSVSDIFFLHQSQTSHLYYKLSNLQHQGVHCY